MTKREDRAEVERAVRFLDDAYWESLDDLQYAKVTLVESMGWRWEDWCETAPEDAR